LDARILDYWLFGQFRQFCIPNHLSLNPKS